ncbi:nascent polypeptide-associated complex subunit alpha, muscle-specific form-like [Scylla paramamosain]|uniref:nascent polypeptide-associated complex subunit alpha, muscle-specific form-like n=1 Tax=Scylla paramamosain TaxID=85552 RepID=UPI003083490D
MESWVIIAAHLLLQLVHSITGAALEGVRLSVTPTTPPTPTPSQAAPYWMRPVPPDPPTDTSGGARGGAGTEGPGATHTPAPPDTTRGLQETQGPGGATHTVFPQLLPQETLAPPASSSPTSATQTRDAAAGQVPGSATVNQVTPEPAAAGTGAPQGAEPGDSSSSRKTQVTSLPGSSSGPPPPLPPRPPSRSPDHSAAIKASSGSPVTPLTPHTPSPTGSPPPNWANGRLGTSTGNPGHSAHPLPPALPPPSPIDTSQTDRAQLARIWSAGEDDQWAGGGRRGGLRQRPPWAWTKGRRRRRKLPGEPAPPLPDLPPVPVPRRAPAQTPSLPGRVESSSHDSIGGGSDARVPTSAVQAAPQLDGGDGAGRYEVLRPGGGHIDFKVTETGEFDGFSVTRTEEVDDAPPDPHQANTSWAGVTRGEAASDRHDSPSDGGIAASGREKLPGESDRSPEGTPLPEDRTNDAPGEISLSTTSSQGEDDRAAPSSPLPTLEDIYSRELSQMKQEVQAPQYGLARPRAEAAGAEATTLPSLYNGDLIPPLPDHWGRPWSGVGRLGDFSGAVNTPAPAPEVNQPLATFPAQVQTEVPGEGTPWNVEGSTGHPATAPPHPQAAAPHTSREDENDGAWQARHLTEHNVSTAGTAATPGPVPPPPSGPQHEARRAADMKHGGGRQHTTRKRRSRHRGGGKARGRRGRVQGSGWNS